MSQPTVTPTKAILYTRVSTGKQALSGLGLEAQLAKCKAEAERRGYEIIDIQTDPAITGKDEVSDRPGLQRVIAQAAHEPSVAVIVYSLSRLARRQSLTWKLIDERGEYGLQVVSATEPFDVTTTMGRCMVGMIAIFCQLEADLCSERTSAALAARKARGHKLGPPHFADKDPETAQKIYDLYDGGLTSTVKLAAEATRLGLKPARAQTWSQQAVMDLIRLRAKRRREAEEAAAG